jgi:hypothetical protein
MDAFNIIIAKSDAAVQAALHYLTPHLVLSPEQPTNTDAKWIKTRLFTESIIDENDVWIPEVDARRVRHVAAIQTLAIEEGLKLAEGKPLVILSGDVKPTPDWLERLEEAVKDFPLAGMIGGVVPTGMSEDCKSWWFGMKPVALDATFAGKVVPVYATTLDCCLLTNAAAASIVPFSGELLTEWEIAGKLNGHGTASKHILLHTLIQCEHG